MQKTDNLFINTITFDYPKEKLKFYFSLEDRDDAHYTRLYRSNFPKEIKSVFPGLTDATEFIYTTFTYRVDGLVSLSIDLKNESPDFVKQYYNDQVRYYFRKFDRQLIKPTFIRDNQIWLRSKSDDTTQYFVYEKYTIKVGIAKISQFPELTITYDGKSKLLKINTIELVEQGVPTDKLKWVLNWSEPKKAYLCKYEDLAGKQDVKYEKVFPVLNNALVPLLNIELPTPAKDNRYLNYEIKIRKFFKEHIFQKSFYDLFPVNCKGDFISVPQTRIGHTSDESNQLAFNNGVDIVPHSGVKLYGPFRKPNFTHIRYFFIFHKDNQESQEKLCDYFKNGHGYFKGLTKYVSVPFFEDNVANIVFVNKENPLEEIAKVLQNRNFADGVTNIAIYLTPYSKNTTNVVQHEIYYKVKEELLKYGITSQCIDTEKMNEQVAVNTFWLSLNNIAIAILAKLGGIPWRINTLQKDELIVGVGAFTHYDTKTTYIASAFSFQNTGQFNRFEYFMKDQTDELAGSIEQAIKDYTSINKNIDRLIIHFYKEMSQKEFEPIEKTLYHLGIPDIPVYVVAINKTESEDYVIFDKDFKQRMPESGTYVNISDNTYLLCNNTRYGTTHKSTDGYPFPVKLKIDCSDKSLLRDIKTVKELIDQVYQFSRIYWKSVKQQNLPVTVKYPEMVAQIAPHFNGTDIPDAGKDTLWFL